MKKAEGEDVEKKTVIETQTGEESVIEDFGGLDTLTTGSNFAPTTTEIATTETSTTVTTMATTTATSGQVTTTVVPAAVDNVHILTFHILHSDYNIGPFFHLEIVLLTKQPSDDPFPN